MLRFIFLLLKSLTVVAVSRLLRGPVFKNWPFRLQCTVYFLRSYMPYITRFEYPEIRQRIQGLTSPLHPEVTSSSRQWGDVECLQLDPPQLKGDEILLYVHGGGYVVGSPEHELAFASLLAKRLGRQVLSVRYHLSPEAPCPAPAQDVAQVISQLTNESAKKSRRLVVCGTSAGGGTVLGAISLLRERQQRLPALCIGISPFVEPSCSSASWRKNAAYDYIEVNSARAAWKAYAGELSFEDPQVSPLKNDLTAFPPLLLFSGSAESMADDVLALEEHAKKAGVSVSHLVEPGMIHAYPTLGIDMPERERCLQMIELAIAGLSKEP